MYYVYVIKNDRSKIYIGQTADLEKRLERHNDKNSRKLRSYTSINKGPWKLIYKEEFETRKKAIEREKYLKSHIGRDWLKLKLGPVAQR